MMNSRIPAMRNQSLIGVGIFGLALWAAWRIGNEVAANDVSALEYVAMGVAACAMAVGILRSWRNGFYMFFVWMMFEDLPRKYMGNNPVLFFGKDALLAIVYVALFREILKGREKSFRPPFLFFLSLFVWLGVLQIFNPNSPHVLYGLLGFKVYFYYVPLVFVGYALIRTDEDLRKMLVVSCVLAGIISALGIAQAILGNQFLNPRVLAPELQELGDLTKSTPISNQLFSLPDSVFVSTGRFAAYLVVTFILAAGAAGYLLLHTRRGRKVIFASIGIIVVATMLSGSRSAVISVLLSSATLSAGFLWGAPWRWRQAHRLIKAMRRSLIVAALGLACVILVFPEAAGSRIAFYTETLNPNSSAYQLGERSWDYPIENLQAAFDQPNWMLGNGIGTASLGAQYVAKLLGQRPPNLGVEEGYGTLIVEMGIIAPFLWILWTAMLLHSCWKILKTLRATRFAPLAFAILWLTFLVLYIWTYASLSGYENYTSNAYMWLMIGILFRLPELSVPTLPTVIPKHLPSIRKS